MEPMYDAQSGACLVFDTSALVTIDNPVQTLWSFEQGNDVAVIPQHVLRELNGLARQGSRAFPVSHSSSPSPSSLQPTTRASTAWPPSSNNNNNNNNSNMTDSNKDEVQGKARAIANFLTDLQEHNAKQAAQQQAHAKKKARQEQTCLCVHSGVVVQGRHEIYAPLSALSRKPDTDIVSCAVYFGNAGRPPSTKPRRVMKRCTVLVTNDVMMKLKAMAYDIPVMSYDEVRAWMGRQ